MNATEARQALLVRAFETPMAAPWSAADARWAGDEAARLEGEGAAADRLIARRAALATQRLAERDPAIATALAASAHTTNPTGWAWLAVAAAFGCGLALDAVGPAQRLNVVALPMLGVLAWNVAVLALVLVGALARALRGERAAAAASWPARSWPTRSWPARSWPAAWWARPRGARADRATPPALRRFWADAVEAGQPLLAGRVAFALHAGAAALAAGLVASLYARGLAVEYRAGWDSTFLTAEGVHRLLSVVLWPALTLGGAVLPAPEQLAALRFSAGPGENAAPWIHALALTVALVVLLPRGLLAARAAWQCRRLARDFPLDLRSPYFQRLLRARHDEPVAVQVLPYSYRLAESLRPGLQAVLERALGSRVTLELLESLPSGSEDDLARRLPAAQGRAVALRLPLFAMTATPERETHGAFVAAVDALQAPEWRRDAVQNASSGAPRVATTHAPFDVLVDESAFRGRFDATRVAQRRAAWQALLAAANRRALFVDLAQPDLDVHDAVDALDVLDATHPAPAPPAPRAP